MYCFVDYYTHYYVSFHLKELILQKKLSEIQFTAPLREKDRRLKDITQMSVTHRLYYKWNPALEASTNTALLCLVLFKSIFYTNKDNNGAGFAPIHHCEPLLMLADRQELKGDE